MFFSFSTDDGSRVGHGHETDLDDLDDPHLRASEASIAPPTIRDDDDDPYLRLDEDEHISRLGFTSRNHQQSIPLIASPNASVASESPKGWLAHLAASPLVGRSPSPARSDSTDSDPPPELFAPTAPRTHTNVLPPPPTHIEPQSLSLTESLLPRDGRSRPLDVFTLPDPRHTTRGRRKYNDSTWTAVWLTGVSVCVFFALLLLFVARLPPNVPRSVLPYTTLLHTVPMLTILTFSSALVAYAHIFLLRVFVRPVMIATSVFIPATLFISAIWAFVGSFMWDGDTVPTWGETVGLRLFSLIPLALSLLTARRLVGLPRDIHTTSSTLTLTTHLLIMNPFLLALSPAILLIMLISSIPFLTLIFRLLLIGYATQPTKDSSRWEWHAHGWANWAIFGAVGVWLWSWGVARGIMRMSCSSVIGAWYFADPDAQPPPPMSTHTIHAALVRATGPSLGTTVLSAMILTIIRLLTLVALFLQRLPAYIPARAFFVVTGIRMAVGYLDTVTTALSKYALVYTGLTGDPFMPSARRAKALTAAVEAKVKHGKRKSSAEPPLMLLTISPLTLSFPFALTTYLFVAHTLNAPQQALGAAVLAGGVTALVGLFCVGLVKDTADTLYICYCIDKDVGERRREEVFVTFEYEPGGQQRRSRPRQPEDIIPLPPQSPPPRAIDNQLPFNPPNSQKSRQQHKRVPSYPEPRQPRQQLIPSASTSLPSQRLTPLSPPPPMVEEDAPDPFQRSFVDDEEDGDLPPLHLRREGTSGGERMLTSAELNIKSHLMESRPYSTSSRSDQGRSGSGSGVSRSRKEPDSLSDSEVEGEGEGGSQYFPGSGFF